MSLADKLYQNVEDLFAWLSLGIKQNILSYCDLETADSKHDLVTKDGSLISIIRLEGYKRFVGANEFAFLCERMSEMFQPAFSQKGHYLQFYFSYDRDTVHKSIEEALTPARKTAERLNLKVDDIFQSRVDTLSQYCGDESVFLVLWTTEEGLISSHRRQVKRDRKAELKDNPPPQAKHAQYLLNVLPEIRNMHQSFVTTVLDDLGHAGFYAELLDVYQAVREIRNSVDPEFTAEEWRPYLPGDKLPLHFKPGQTGEEDDLSALMWPRLDSQVIPRDGENLDLKYARVGDRVYAPVFIELFPKDIKPFYELFRRLINADLPWRVSYNIGSGGIDVSKSKNILAQFLTIASHHNKLIVESHKMLQDMDQRSDNPVVKLYVTFATWAPAEDMNLLKARVAKLAKIIQSWGSCEVRDITGDPTGAVLGSALSVTKNIPVSATAAPLSEAVYMMPFVRPASPWKQGAMLFRTPDGKIWPYQPGSQYQISWVDVVYARSGSGKSVLLSALNLGLCLSAGLSVLPRIAIIDIGPSSKGFISLLQEGLPEEQRHSVRYHRMTMDEKDAVNAFDTPLGARYPTKLHRSFLINFLSLLLVEDISERPYEGMTSLLSMIVDEAYLRYSEGEQPKPYVAGVVPEIDAVLATLNFQVEGKQVTWWQVTDALFAAEKMDMALRAQRYAMPTIADTISIAHTHSLKDLFGEVKTPSGEGYIECYCRIISSVIRNYPTLTSVSKLSLEGARVVALDLDEVAKTGSTAAEKQTAMMYMLSRHILAQDFFLNTGEVEKFPETYQPFHRARVKEIMEEPKRMVFDEFHRTSRSPAVRDQILQDMREGRKWKTHVALASQSLTDFDALMIEFATSVFILDSGPAKTIEETVKTFGLTDTEKVALSNRVHGPSSEGATFIAQFVTKRGMNTQLLTSTISPVELWGFNTNTEDVFIREALYKEIGPQAARRLLAERFPRGSAAKELEVELKTNPTATIAEICDEVIQDLISEFRRRHNQWN